MTTDRQAFLRQVLRAACLASLLAAAQAHADTPPDEYLSSGLGTLLHIFLPFWF